jgi:hypothetical protein
MTVGKHEWKSWLKKNEKLPLTAVAVAQLSKKEVVKKNVT